MRAVNLSEEDWAWVLQVLQCDLHDGPVILSEKTAVELKRIVKDVKGQLGNHPIDDGICYCNHEANCHEFIKGGFDPCLKCHCANYDPNPFGDARGL